ncbi:hypothetical protein L596_027090 [Steinernema carpocapsae]|uniref:Uncharacterized protein n=1 Tax=Steinernema carpocapsae TaxID=34508 RepID=A0A4U5M3C2_STECR|nr:hypothetical protein L596_027090 [Steinernema carpocapsae]
MFHFTQNNEHARVWTQEQLKTFYAFATLKAILDHKDQDSVHIQPDGHHLHGSVEIDHEHHVVQEDHTSHENHIPLYQKMAQLSLAADRAKRYERFNITEADVQKQMEIIRQSHKHSYRRPLPNAKNPCKVADDPNVHSTAKVDVTHKSGNVRNLAEPFSHRLPQSVDILPTCDRSVDKKRLSSL